MTVGKRPYAINSPSFFCIFREECRLGTRGAKPSALFDSFVQDQNRSVERRYVFHSIVSHCARKRDNNVSAADNVLDAYIVRFVLGSVALSVESRITDTHGVKSVIHIGRLSADVINSVDLNIVEPTSTLIKKTHVSAKSGCADVANLNVAKVGAKTHHPKFRLNSSLKSRKSYAVVLGKSGYILNYDIVAALTEVDSVRVLDKHLIVLLAHKTAVLVSLGIYTDIACKKVDITEITVSAIYKIERPPPLISAGYSRNFEAVHVGEEQKIVLPDRGQSVLALSSFGKSVILTAVKDSLSLSYDIYVPDRSRDGFAYIRTVILVI